MFPDILTSASVAFAANGNVLERYDTDAYTFAYMSAGTPHGSSQYLVLIEADGTYRDYSDDFESVSFWGTKVFDNLEIDSTNEKVYFRYDADYEINLKTGGLIRLG